MYFSCFTNRRSFHYPLCGKYSVVLNSKCLQLHFKYVVSKQQVSVRIIFSFDFSREIRPWNWPWQLVNTEHASLKKKSSVYVAYSKVLTNALYWYNHSVQKSPKSLILCMLAKPPMVVRFARQKVRNRKIAWFRYETFLIIFNHCVSRVQLLLQ